MIPPFSSIKLFETKIFLKNSRIPSRKFSALWGIKTSTENRDKPPLVHKFFSIPENFSKTEEFFYKAIRFGPVRQKNSTKPWCPSPSYAWKLSIKEFFWNTKVFSNEIFWYSLTKKLFDGKLWYPPPLIHKIFFPTRNFLKHRIVPWRSFFGPVRLKKVDKTVKLPPSFAWKFSLPEFFRNTAGFSYEFYGHWEIKIFQRSLVISPSYA